MERASSADKGVGGPSPLSLLDFGLLVSLDNKLLTIWREKVKNKLKQRKPKNKPKKTTNPEGLYLKLAFHLKGAISPSLA